MNKSGFTLIETIVAIGLIAMIGLATNMLLSRTFQASNKASVITTIKQNGANVLTQFETKARMSSAVVCLDSKSIILKDAVLDNYYLFWFTDQTPTTNGSFLFDPNPSVDPKSLPSSCSSTKTTNQTVVSNSDLNSGVSIKNSAFTKISQAGSIDAIKISFDLYPSISSNSNTDEDLKLHFEQTIQLK